MEIPGMRAEDLKLSLEGSMLTVSGERKFEATRKEARYRRVDRSHGSFLRTLTLPATVDPNTVKAKYEDGILHVTITRKAEARAHPIRISGETKQLTAEAA